MEAGRVPRQSAIKMMETMKTLAPAERRPQQHAPASAPRAAPTAPAPAPAVPEAAPKRKGGALPQGPPSGGGAAAAAAAPAEPAAKRRRPAGDPSVGVLEWLEAEAEKREIDHSNPALPAGIAPPQRPTSAALLFLHKIRSRIKQPPNSAWGPKQLAQGVTRLFEALPPAHQQQYRQAAKESMDRYKAELARHRPLGSKALECGSSADQGRGRAPSAYKVYERNVMPRLRHANPSKHEEDLIKMCKKEWGGISEKERKTYQFLAERDRERLRTQELLWREASQGTSRLPTGDGGTPGSKDRTFHTLIPQFCVFCGSPIITYMEPNLKKHCKSCGRAFSLEVVAFAVGGGDDSNAKEDEIDVSEI